MEAALRKHERGFAAQARAVRHTGGRHAAPKRDANQGLRGALSEGKPRAAPDATAAMAKGGDAHSRHVQQA